jgi:RNAse (barnase) inhibitor barstar
MADVSQFFFGIDEVVIDDRADFVARVPAGISARDQLFESLKRGLVFPDYFGGNWDALSECLRDLSWIRKRRVVIVHESIPVLEANILAAYCDLLAECVRDWKGDDQHELVVVFPKESRSLLERV